ncbi:histone acetyltransferase KAT6B [Lingula anatina]|uniref:Histone acetyltransferase KAT6B n=1 Tax=Lingula anatina TaxID=7574 RepID=A0A1S3JPM7_LINAN|nr:histone acetyltransferase KAT6B [Lingula anatina]|eukprot:XP_013412312.2 histone acetyltransferase KAT6B [Lingula anatina]
MAVVRNKDWILETIDQLRKRKARPDIERICHMLQRKHGLTREEIEADLESLVEAEVVIKVDYKGSTSYRNAAKWRKSHLGGLVLNSTEVSKRIVNALRALTKTESLPDSETQTCNINNSSSIGVSLSEIEKWIANEDPESTLVKANLQVALDREVDAGQIARLNDNTYVLSDNKKPKAHNPTKIGGPGKGGLHHGKRGRPATKKPILKKKHLLEPQGVKSEERALSHEEPVPKRAMKVCDFCLLTETFNRKGVPENLLVCKDCNAKAHPSCMEYSAELARRATRSPWQCIDCKTCNICEDAGDPDAMLFCDACDKGYHMDCHNPLVAEKPTGKWMCSRCLLEGSQVSVSAMEESEMASVDSHRGAFLKCFENFCLFAYLEKAIYKYPFFISTKSPLKPKQEIPDASRWGVDEVVTYFKESGFLEQAEAFREQEIDGISLMLMKRSDVLSGLALKLGPALKMYNYVKQLQCRGQPPLQ